MFTTIKICIVFVATFTNVVSSNDIPSFSVKQSEELELLGEVGDKIFYAGNEEHNWYAAKQVCESKGLKFATVETTEEETFLNLTLSIRFADPTWISHYWTSGRDRMSKEQYIWDTTGAEIGNLSDMDYFGPLTCLSIAVPDYKYIWDARPCYDSWPPICQKPVEKQRL